MRTAIKSTKVLKRYTSKAFIGKKSNGEGLSTPCLTKGFANPLADHPTCMNCTTIKGGNHLISLKRNWNFQGCDAEEEIQAIEFLESLSAIDSTGRRQKSWCFENSEDFQLIWLHDTNATGYCLCSIKSSGSSWLPGSLFSFFEPFSDVSSHELI